MVQTKFWISGMSCSACSAHIEKTVSKLTGVQSASVNLLAQTMVVNYDEAQISQEELMQSVETEGYGAGLLDSASGNEGTGKQAASREVNTPEKTLRRMKIRLGVSFLFLIPLMYLSMHHMFHWPIPFFFQGTEHAFWYVLAQCVLTVPVLVVNWEYYHSGYRKLFRFAPNMDSLIAIGSSAAFLYGVYALIRIGLATQSNNTAAIELYRSNLYFESAAMILALITLGKYLETRSKNKTGEAVSKLLDLAPKTAVILRDGQEIEIPASQLSTGDIVVVKPGWQVPADGIILEGSSSLDESAVTGESIPAEKHPGDTVIAATINQSGSFRFRAEKVGGETTLAQIIRLVEDAAATKAPIAKLADKVAGIFVPVVLLIALASLLIWLLTGHSFEFSLSIAISVLVISCPCSLGLATPVAILVGTGKGAEYGILIKSAEALETTQTAGTVVLDKTGTITRGKPEVTDILPSQTSDLTPDALLELAASLENASEHPLADAILSAAREQQLVIRPISDFQAIPGLGIRAKIDDVPYFAGNRRFLQTQNILLTEQEEQQSLQLAQDGKTPLFFAKESSFLGMLAVSDTLKETSLQAIEEMRQLGLQVVMLTGDNRQTAAAMQKRLTITRVIAEVLPQDKEREIRSLQETGEKVIMVGDGINDAPALARADVGMAIGAGTDIAMDSADIILMKSNLQDVVTTLQLSKAVIRNIKQNLFWAFFYNSLGIPLAAGILYPVWGITLNPMIAAAAMSLSSVCVVTNALRLRRFHPHHPDGTQKITPAENAE